MCGIVGIASRKEFSSQDLLNGLKKLEYRGYDSAGIAMMDKEIYIEKSVGEISNLRKKIKNKKGTLGIAHTRWATHGNVSEKNAHPHFSCNKEIAIVHNGIIKNFAELRKELDKKGHRFNSDTDSELIAHFFEGKEIKKAIPEFFRKFEGEFSVLMIKKGDNKIYAFKRGSPMVLGLAEGENIVASDVYAFTNKTSKVIFFNENDFAIISSEDYEIYKVRKGLKRENRKPILLKLPEIEESKGKYQHYMMKEIKEEPESAERLLLSLKTQQKGNLKELKNLIEKSNRLVFVASGTSYHAALLGVQFVNKVGIESHAIIASEFRNFTLLDKNALAIAISQSGETMDVIEALRGIKAKGVKIASLVNVPYSTIQRMSNVSISIEAGQEICVASTKTFVNQVITLMKLASLFGYKENSEEVPKLIKNIFNQEEKIKFLAKELKNKKDIYVLGRGFSYPVAREIALKLKEISYIHAEGMMAGELKHGTLALIEKGTPVICLIPKSDTDILSNAKEVEARGARIIAFSEDDYYKDRIKIPAVDKGSFAILSTIAGQLLTYHIAKEKGLSIDKPRNLAKSVTTL